MSQCSQDSNSSNILIHALLEKPLWKAHSQVSLCPVPSIPNFWSRSYLPSTCTLTLPQVLWPLLSTVRTNLRGQSSLWPPLFPINRLLPCSWWPNYIDYKLGHCDFYPHWPCRHISVPPRDVLSLCSLHFRAPSPISGLQDCILLPAPKFPYPLSAHPHAWLLPIILFTCLNMPLPVNPPKGYCVQPTAHYVIPWSHLPDFPDIALKTVGKCPEQKSIVSHLA